MTLILACFLGIFIIVISSIAFVFRRKYESTLRINIEDKYLFKCFMPVSLLLLDWCKHGYKSKYDRHLLILLAELHNKSSSLQRLKLHYANKLALMLVGLVLTGIVGCASYPDISYFLFSLGVQGAIFYYTDNDLKEKVKKRRLQIKIDFPVFINKLTLLINAGMNISRAIEKIAFDKNSKAPLYKELNIVIMDILSGKPESKALEEFSRRCRTPEIMKFVSVILQNLRKGTSELVPILRLLSVECWEIRKNTAKKLGEEASTKLLFPMMIMFIAILIIVVTPAVLALQSI